MFEKATFAGGCFWCTEAIFERIKGIKKVTSGYAGGEVKNPTYEKVSEGDTGYAEAVRIEFDPKIITYDHLLEIFWATHDPTTSNRQGADVGTQYRSAIFYENEKQKEKALSSKEKVKGSVTEILPFKNFYEAEEFHQKFYDRNKNTNLYCSLVINPKIQKLVEKFNKDLLYV